MRSKLHLVRVNWRLVLVYKASLLCQKWECSGILARFFASHASERKCSLTFPPPHPYPISGKYRLVPYALIDLSVLPGRGIVSTLTLRFRQSARSYLLRETTGGVCREKRQF